MAKHSSMPDSPDILWQFAAIILLYTTAVVAASIAGGLLPELIRITHIRMQLMISFVGGVMLGIAIFHMLPHSIVALGMGRIDQVAWGMMLGLVATFFMLRLFHFHQHGPADFGLEDKAEPHSHHDCGAHEPVGHSHEQHAASAQTVPPRWAGVMLGLGIHTLMDGAAMGAGIAAESDHSHGTLLPGFGIFLAVLLHKPLDAITITSLMQNPTSTRARRLVVNIAFALLCPIGMLLFFFGTGLSQGWSMQLAGWGLAFSAGVFLCISLSDLLPEMEFHSHSKLALTISLLLGIGTAWAIGLAEGEHAHGPGPTTIHAEHEHDHSDGHAH